MKKGQRKYNKESSEIICDIRTDNALAPGSRIERIEEGGEVKGVSGNGTQNRSRRPG